MWMITSAEWAPSDSAWAQAASTAGNRSMSTVARKQTQFARGSPPRLGEGYGDVVMHPAKGGRNEE
jgi:hypothetical protein